MKNPSSRSLKNGSCDRLLLRAWYLSSLYALTRWRIWLFLRSQPIFLEEGCDLKKTA